MSNGFSARKCDCFLLEEFDRQRSWHGIRLSNSRLRVKLAPLLSKPAGLFFHSVFQRSVPGHALFGPVFPRVLGTVCSPPAVLPVRERGQDGIQDMVELLAEVLRQKSQ